ncbi:MAG: biotin transporter BioY, partial [Candidatus Sericytochromatia bacterium]|nr:biotin transporter BioY [Candidatus Tanganyikabacteria bacterium]
AEEYAHWKGLVAGLCTITLQVPSVWLTGVFLRPWHAAMAQAVMLAVGLAGLPIFLEGGGPAYALKPTFGYLLGFIPAAWLIAKFAPRGPAGAFLGMVVGQTTMWLIGVAWQVVATRPAGLLDGMLWARSFAGVLQLVPTYLVLMAGITLALGLAGMVKRSFLPVKDQGEGAVVDQVDGHHRAKDSGAGR